MTNNCLIIFTRNPVYGKVKTRLAATVGDDVALKVYQFLVDHTAQVAYGVDAVRTIYYSDTVVNADVWDEADRKVLQEGVGLGERMSNAFRDVLNGGWGKAIIIGTDCYELTRDIIDNAFAQLDQYDVVVGPALDGGYYLLGMKEHYPELFDGIAWSTDSVLQETLSRCDNLLLRYFLLPDLSDIDEEKDLVKTDILEKL